MKIYPTVSAVNRDGAHPGPPSLIPLLPIGLGTGDVESLSSYLTRLACEHWNSPTHLYKAILEWHLSCRVVPVKADSRLDSFTKTSQRLVNALNACSSLRVDFAELTCLSWGDVLSSRIKGALNSNLRWCVECYREMRDIDQPLHNRLLWAMVPVECCERHKAVLSQACPHCNSPQQFIVADSVVGYCQHCGRELFAGTAQPDYESDPSSERLWKSRACHDLVQATRNGTCLDSAALVANIKNIVEEDFNGSVRFMSRELNMGPDVFRGLLSRGQSTNLKLLVDFAFRIDHPPSALFGTDGVLRINRRRSRPRRKHRTYKPMSSKKRAEIRSRLRKIIDSADELSSTTEIAAEVGITRNVLHHRFPEENAEIVSKVKVRCAREKRERDEARAERVRNRALELVAANIYPSDRQVRKDKSILTSHLRLPQIKIVLREIQEEFLRKTAVNDRVLINRIKGSTRKIPTNSEIRRSTEKYDPSERL